MAQPVIQYSFTSGEWAPALNARVDLKQYHSGAALLENFFVDYRGGATKSPGTEFILWCISGTVTVRLIPFQASLTVSYILVFENTKLYFINNGAPVLETGINITGISNANPGVITAANSYANGDRVYISGNSGLTALNGNYYTVANRTAANFTLIDMFGNAVNTLAMGTWTAGGTAARIYTLTSPYASAELAQIKYAQDVNVMVLNHPNYATYTLTYTSATSWALAAATIGSTVSAPTGQAVATTLGAGAWNYAYIITAVDSAGQESGPSAFATLANVLDIRSNAGTNTVTWNAVTGAASYNVYRAVLRSGAAVPAGSMFGLIGNCTALTFIDSNITPDFSIGYPIVRDPFSGSGVQSVSVTAAGSYAGLAFPAVSFSGGGGSGAAGTAVLQATAMAVNSAGSGYNVGETWAVSQGAVLRITSVNGSGGITGITIVNTGNVTSNPVPSNPITIGVNGFFVAATINVTWGVTSVGLTSPGTGYGGAPTVAFSTGAATATAALGAPSAGNPTVPVFHQQRLGLLGPVSAPNQMNFSRPGASFNFNVTDPVRADNAFQGNLKSGQLNTIQAAISQPQGLVVFADNAAWLLNGGSAGSAFDATNLVANPQIFNGAASLPPIAAVDDILYVQAKGSIVRDLIFNWNKQVYTGADISVQSSHLFYGYTLLEWAFAEEPFKLIWVVRSDGVMLSLTFLREQELIAWTHRITDGSFKSVAVNTEPTDVGNVDAVYTVVQRSINGTTVQFIERLVELDYSGGATDAWCVDCGLQYNGAAATSFTGYTHLTGEAIVGLATDDTGNVTVFSATVSATGGFSITAPASPATGYTRVTAGLAYTAKLTTLGIDTGNPTIQGKMKKLPAVTVRVKDTLGLEIGTSFDTLVDMDDLIIGNIGKDTNEEVTEALVTGDAVQTLDPSWQVPGQYCIQSADPWPATILGLIPQIAVGDTER